MDNNSKLKSIKEQFKVLSGQEIGGFNDPITEKEIQQIEMLIDQPIPLEFKALYQFANGQSHEGAGLLLGDRFIGSEEILRQLEFSKTLIKPAARVIDNPEESQRLLKNIVDFYLSNATKQEMLGLAKPWYRMEFTCSTGSFGGPYLFANKNTTSKEREILEIKYNEYSSISGTIQALHDLEEKSFNWDELKFWLYSNGSYEVERSFYNFDEDMPLTSTPIGCIKKKYFHYKWIPIFSDYGGNYIGIDLDPDTKGTKGQIIVYGRDEEAMIVLASDLNSFLDLVMDEMKNPKSKLLNLESHLHDELKALSK